MLAGLAGLARDLHSELVDSSSFLTTFSCKYIDAHSGYNANNNEKQYVFYAHFTLIYTVHAS